jgi:hypothetical protein
MHDCESVLKLLAIILGFAATIALAYSTLGICYDRSNGGALFGLTDDDLKKANKPMPRLQLVSATLAKNTFLLLGWMFLFFSFSLQLISLLLEK